MPIMHQDLYLFPIRYRFYNLRPMQVRLRVVLFDKQSAGESKSILTSWPLGHFLELHFFSDNKIFHLSGHVNKQNIHF